MQYEYWTTKSGRSHARDELERALTDKKSQRAYQKKLEIFNKYDLVELKKAGTVKSLKKSKNKLHEFIIPLPKRTARMFFVIFNECAFFLHFIIKKSLHGRSTPKRSIDTAESRATTCLLDLNNIYGK